MLQNHKTCGKGKVNKEDAMALKKLILRQKFELISCVRLSLDLVHAVNTLPMGWLWGEKLNTWQVGLIATTSSFIGLYQYFSKRNL